MYAKTNSYKLLLETKGLLVQKSFGANYNIKKLTQQYLELKKVENGVS